MNTGIFPITKILGLRVLNPGISGLAKLVGILGFGIAIHNGWTDVDDNRQSLMDITAMRRGRIYVDLSNERDAR